MKLEDLDQVRALVHRRDQIKSYITAAMGRPDSIAVTIAATHMDDNMVALVKPMVVRELSARIATIDRQLQQLGVDVG